MKRQIFWLLTVLLAFLALVGFLWPFGKKQAITPCPEEASLAIYRELQKSLRGWNSVGAWIHRPSKQTLDAEAREIIRIRQWVSTLPSGCIKDEYDDWLTHYYELGLREAYDEVLNHTETNRMNRYDEHMKVTLERAEKMQIPVPPKPKEQSK